MTATPSSRFLGFYKSTIHSLPKAKNIQSIEELERYIAQINELMKDSRVGSSFRSTLLRKKTAYEQILLLYSKRKSVLYLCIEAYIDNVLNLDDIMCLQFEHAFRKFFSISSIKKFTYSEFTEIHVIDDYSITLKYEGEMLHIYPIK